MKEKRIVTIIERFDSGDYSLNEYINTCITRVDEMGVDEMGVDEMGGNHTNYSLCLLQEHACVRKHASKMNSKYLSFTYVACMPNIKI